ncbi:MAG: hypothetical protein IJV12_03005 [Acidaminococcaceae bacterium]|nr:hypothetical protein [Acidaminococcaceae bacterium]
MDEINSNPLLDFKTMTAILTADPDGVAMIGAWNGMKTLANLDPEGCVRLTPALPMDIPALAGFFHCPESIMEKTVAIFEKLKRLVVKDGLIRILDGTTGSPAENLTETVPGRKAAGYAAIGNATISADTKKAPDSEEAKARKREQNRIRQAERRARQRQEKLAAQSVGTADRSENNKAAFFQNTAAICDSHAVTNCDACDTRDSQHDRCDTPAQNRMNTDAASCVTERDSSVTGCDTDNTDNITNSNINALNPIKTDKHISIYKPQNAESKTRLTVLPRNVTKNGHSSQPEHFFNPSGRCLPYVPGKQHGKIPLRQLPETVRNVIDEWNKLPLPKYNGLIPSLLEKLKHLLQRYGENTVLKTIAGIANSAFL